MLTTAALAQQRTLGFENERTMNWRAIFAEMSILATEPNRAQR